MSTDRRRERRDRRVTALVEEEALVQSVGNVLADALKEKGISRATLAKRMHVSGPNVTQILRGDNNLKLKTVARLAYALGMRMVVELEPLKRPSVGTERWVQKTGTTWPRPKLKIAAGRQ